MRALLPAIALAACAVLSGPLRADSASSLRTLDECLAQVAPGAPSGAAPNAAQGAAQRAARALPAPAGIEELRLACPNIEQAIIDSGLSTQLPDHWQRWLDRSSIEDLDRLLRRYQSPLPGAAPGVATLYQVAHTLTTSEPQHGWWQDFKAWLRKWLSPPEAGDSSWLNRWLSNVTVPRLMVQSLLYVLMAMILVGTLWIVWREIRLARAGARTGASAANRSLPLAAHEPPLNLDAVDRALPRDQPALLLRLLVQALLRSGRLSNDRPLTHRELAARSGFDDAGQRDRFERISLLAERLLYGPASVAEDAQSHASQSQASESQASQALADGRELYVQLAARAAPAA